MKFTMGMEPIVAWVIVRRYDHPDPDHQQQMLDTPPMPFYLKPNSDYHDLKIQIKDWLGLPENGNEVIKLRRPDEALITLSCLLDGSCEDKPYFLDIARVHQTSPVSPRLAMSATYIETVRSKLNNLEKRVERVESLVPEFRSQRLANIERTMQQLGCKVNFLDKRFRTRNWSACMHTSSAYSACTGSLHTRSCVTVLASDLRSDVLPDSTGFFNQKSLTNGGKIQTTIIGMRGE